MPGTFVYTPAAGTVLSAGIGQTLSVTFTPTDAANYTTATATVTITVSQGDAGDHLADAGGDHLRDGAECDAAERDAASVPGTFVYTPAAGTVLNAGVAQTLSVTFTPTDAANYTTATATVTITVTKATPAITWPAPAAITSTARRSARRS